MLFKEYQEAVDKYVQRDARELNFQNRIIIPMLESIISEADMDVDVVDSSTIYRGDKSREIKEEGAAPPDLLLVKNWRINGKNELKDYILAVEVKSPLSQEAIYQNKTLHKHVQNEIENYAKKYDNIILTDCYTWQFFHQGQEKSIQIDLVDSSDENKEVQWKKNANGEPQEWKEVTAKIRNILLSTKKDV